MTDLSPADDMGQNAFINALVNTNIKSDADTLAGAVSAGKVLVTETNSSAILTDLNKLVFSGNNLEVLPLRENPYSNSYGQNITSAEETFWRRIVRADSIKTYARTGTAITPSGSYAEIASHFLSPDSGKILYPKQLTCSWNFTGTNNITGNVIVYVYTASGTYYTLTATMQNGIPHTFNFDGEFAISQANGGSFQVYVNLPNSYLNGFTQSVTTANTSPILTGMTYATASMKGMTISGTGIPSSTKIVDIISTTSVLLSANCTASATVTGTLADTAGTFFAYAVGGQRTY